MREEDMTENVSKMFVRKRQSDFAILLGFRFRETSYAYEVSRKQTLDKISEFTILYVLVLTQRCRPVSIKAPFSRLDF